MHESARTACKGFGKNECLYPKILGSSYLISRLDDHRGGVCTLQLWGSSYYIFQ